jgi:hypothetical protein
MIHREKLEKARELLACSSLNINEISQMCIAAIGGKILIAAGRYCTFSP